MKRDFTLYLVDIIDNVNDASGFISDLSYEQFMADKKTVNAVIRSIEVVGEATKQVPEEIRAKRPNVPWKAMAGMRDKCIHGYVDIDYEVVWAAAKEELPAIRDEVQSLLDELNREKK